MNVAAILGSRNPQGQTARAAGALLDVLAAGGAEVERFFLPAMKIERCRQCDDNGWGICRTQGRCVIEDDLASLVARMKSADLVVFATPVYFSDLSESLKAFLDRFRRTCLHEKGKAGIEGKPAVGICVAGGGGGGAPQCALNLEKTLARCGFELLDLVPVRRQNLDTKLRVLRLTGEALAAQMK
jgi:multimeric flavodoxin WrbA